MFNPAVGASEALNSAAARESAARIAVPAKPSEGIGRRVDNSEVEENDLLQRRIEIGTTEPQPRSPKPLVNSPVESN